MVDQLRSEQLAYDFLVNELEKRGDRRMLTKLVAAPRLQGARHTPGLPGRA